ncbi:MAG: xanthine dehydrogenase family protein molybdopterin-binding subunit, partial [Chloroflexota bacterium]|nr:xanthine dehydrogenase family protein molybdopterin-binding subunit [Chloroflexota bacterium]
MTEMKIGVSPHRVGGYERVTGTQEYLADIPFTDVLHAKLVTIPCGRARIISIDKSAAEAVPGVRLVMTADDLPQPVLRYGPQYQDRPVLAVGETKFHGEAVAAVAADSRDAAEEAARLVGVEYEELPGVYTVAQALASDAPLVREPELRPDDELADTNVLATRVYEWGDVESVTADLVIEETYSFPMITHFAIEPHGFVAAPDEDGIAIWSTIQHPYLLQTLMADLLDLPLAKVRVYAPDPGGGFGGKQNIKLEPLVAFMALETGRPVRLVLTLDESFQANRRVSAEVTVRSGFDRDGHILFEDIGSDYMLGAYADIAERVVAKSQYTAAGPYKVPNVRISARSILSNTTPACAFRGFGTPQVNWAVESNIDAAARALGIDRAEIRLRNLATRGEEVVPNDTPADGLWPQTVQKAMRMIGWDTPVPPGRGRGLAVGIKSSATTGLSYSTVRLLVDGSVIIYAGTSDMGQGARTIFAQIAALEPGYADPEGLLAAARREMEEERRRAEVHDLYRRAVLAVDAGQWQEARGLLGKVQEQGPGYRETERLLAKVEAEIEREQAERQHQEQIARLRALPPEKGQIYKPTYVVKRDDTACSVAQAFRVQCK